jgi:hypothetical protein
MRRSLFLSCLPLLISAVAAGCSDDGLGQPCTPTVIPCDASGQNCGFRPHEKIVQKDAPGCPSDVCIVHKLDNGTLGTLPADPRVVCTGVNDPAGCVTQAALDDASYCSCRCNLADNKRGETCTCPGGFVCEPFFGAESYCVKPAALDGE